MATQREIQYHYDISNDFFKLFLDNKYRMYSCGVWEEASTLEQAQENKLKRILNFAHVKKGSHLLDIGCGWGGMLDYAVNVAGVSTATGITLSQSQYEHIIQNKLPSVSVHLCSWSDFGIPEKRFDSIVSIGAMEHFSSLNEYKNGKQLDIYEKFFQLCSRLSKNNAYLGLQTIVMMKKPETLQSMRDTHYLLKYVFPGSALPDISSIQMAMNQWYEPVELRTIGLDYAKTLKEWKYRLNQHSKKIINQYGENILTHYNHYFDSAIRSFENGYISLLQMSLIKKHR
jgi:cyclopropane-fatty-acyl-phospholipid synthase